MDAELNLIDKVELRITLASSNESFEKNLAVFLPPLILKLSSKFREVRTKILKFLGHLMIRINSSEDISLPIEKLLDQAKSPVGLPESGVVDSATIDNFNQVKLYSYLFVCKGLERESDESKFLSYIPLTIECLEKQLGISKLRSSSSNGMVTSRCFNVLLKLFGRIGEKTWKNLQTSKIKISDSLVYNNSGGFTKDFLKLNSNLESCTFILDQFSKLFLLLPTPNTSANNDGPLQFYFCPGLTNDEVKFLTYDAGSTFNYQSLLDLRIKILLFLQLIDFEVFNETQSFEKIESLRFLLLSFAGCDNSSNINSLASSLLRRIPHITSESSLLNNDFLINKCTEYYGGDDSRKPVPVLIQECILSSVFCKSKESLNLPDNVLVEIVTKGFQASSSNTTQGNYHLKLKKSSLVFSKYIANSSTSTKHQFILTITATIMNGILEDGWPRMQVSAANTPAVRLSLITQIRRLQYETLSDLISSDPSLLIHSESDEDLKYLKFFFNSLKGEEPDNISIVQDSLGKLINKFAAKFNELNGITKSELGARLKAFFKDLLARDMDSTILDGDDDIIMANTEHSRSISSSTSAFRYLSLKFINALFDYDDVEARFLNLYGTYAHNRYDVIEVAQKGLNPYWFNINKSSLNIYSSETDGEKTTRELLGMNTIENLNFPTFKKLIKQLKTELLFLQKHPNTSLLIDILYPAFEYLLKILVTESVHNSGKSGTVLTIDEDWDFRTMKALELDDKVRYLLVTYLGGDASSDSIIFYLQMVADCYFSRNNLIDNTKFSRIGEFVINDGSSPINIQSFNQVYTNIARYGNIFNNLISLCSANILSQISYMQGEDPLSANLMMNLISINIKDLKKEKYNKTFFARLIQEQSLGTLAKTIGILISSTSSVFKSDVSNLLQPLTEDVVNDNNFNDFVISRLVIAASILGRSTFTNNTSLDNIVGVEEAVKFLHVFYHKLKQNYDNKNWRHFEASLDALNDLCRYGAININNAEIRDTINNIQSLVELKVKKCDEKSVLSWAYLSLVSQEFNESADKYIQILYDTHISKQVEYLFASGEALTILACGWDSKVLIKSFDIQGYSLPRGRFMNESSESSKLDTVLKTVLKGCANTKPSLRKACCIWLLSLVQYCGHLPVIKANAKEIHVAFMRYLASSDDIVQEAASTGLGLIYEMGDFDLKESLVKGLMKSFTGSASSVKLTAGTISEDTELFEPGILNTPDGSISTYKDILNLATDMGDPSLVYKFMSLTKSSALWASRKGVAFGLSNIMSKSNLENMLQSNDELAKRLVVKLYRYRFDPNENVSRSMNDIWNILVPNSSKIIELNSDAILKELLASIGNREWRTRQATTTAMIDLLQIIPVEKYQNNLEDIWTMAFRSIDDIKESVRESGTKLTKYLSNSLIKSIENSHTSSKNYEKILGKLIPFLIGTKGVLSSVDEVRSFSMKIIIKLCMKAGDSLKPFIPGLVEELLVLMSTLEPQIVNYLALNADKYNLKSSDIDAKRLNSVGHSPVMEAIERMMDLLIDDDLIKEFINKLNSAIKRSVGLPSKVAGSKVIVTLVVKHLPILKESHASVLMKTCTNQLSDRNETVAFAYAYAAGHLCRVAKIKTILNYGNFLKDLYFDYKDDKDRKIAAFGCEAIAKYSTDNFNKVSSFFLPLAFVCQHDDVKEISEIFKTVWTENTGGKSAVKLYIDEIAEIVSTHLQSQQYLIRQVCAKAIAQACILMSGSAIDGKIIGLNDAMVDKLFTILIEACKGRGWKGKEIILDALVTFTENFKSGARSSFPWYEKIEKILLQEAKRRGKNQIQSLKSLGKLVSIFPSTELYNQEIELIRPYFYDSYYENSDSSDDDDEEEEEEEEESSNKKIKTEKQYSKSSAINLQREAVLISLISTLCNSFSIIDSTNGTIPLNLIKAYFTEIAPQVFNLAHVTPTWRTKIAICENTGILIDKIVSHNDEGSLTGKIYLPKEDLRGFYQVIKAQGLGDGDIENVRISAVRITGKMLQVSGNDGFKKQVVSDLQSLHDSDSSSIIKVEVLNVLNL
ncbi:Ecm29 protein [Saccharomycopsis crataegensis]|uniref:Ecm29 protein n=1 Tax=Saccharomycopsis crataegensis TaxID=43959 RepID=A0AAV5QV57_9ASCO|nr:Ecm29 protein [Saccharomycopsis crataegensis]